MTFAAWNIRCETLIAIANRLCMNGLEIHKHFICKNISRQVMIDRRVLVQNFKLKALQLRYRIDTCDSEEQRTKTITRYCRLVYFLLSL